MNSNAIVTCWLLFSSKLEPTTLKSSSNSMRKACLWLKITSQKSNSFKQRSWKGRKSTISCRLSMPKCGKVQKETNRFWPRRMRPFTTLQGRTKSWRKLLTSSEKRSTDSTISNNLTTSLKKKACRSSTKYLRRNNHSKLMRNSKNKPKSSTPMRNHWRLSSKRWKMS